MFKHIVTQISGRITALFTQALALLKALLLNPVGSLLAKFILVFRSVVSQLHRRLNRLAHTAQSPKKGRPVGITKSARSRSKENKTAQTPTAPKLTQAGLKSQGHAKTRRQRAKQPLKAKA
jgi:hypothetical protein